METVHGSLQKAQHCGRFLHENLKIKLSVSYENPKRHSKYWCKRWKLNFILFADSRVIYLLLYVLISVTLVT